MNLIDRGQVDGLLAVVCYELLLLHLLVHHAGLYLTIFELISKFRGQKILHGLVELLLILRHHQGDASLAFGDILDLEGFKKLAAQGPNKFKHTHKNFT